MVIKLNKLFHSKSHHLSSEIESHHLQNCFQIHFLHAKNRSLGGLQAYKIDTRFAHLLSSTLDSCFAHLLSPLKPSLEKGGGSGRLRRRLVLHTVSSAPWREGLPFVCFSSGPQEVPVLPFFFAATLAFRSWFTFAQLDFPLRLDLALGAAFFASDSFFLDGERFFDELDAAILNWNRRCVVWAKVLAKKLDGFKQHSGTESNPPGLNILTLPSFWTPRWFLYRIRTWLLFWSVAICWTGSRTPAYFWKTVLAKELV